MEKKFNYVYVTTNLINGKQYVGDRSCNCEPEKDKYLGSGRPYFENAKIKYGKENFKKEILEKFDTKKEAFNAQEKYIIQFNTLFPNGYNISPKGGHGVKDCFAEESKQKISRKLQGHSVSEKTRLKIKKTRKLKGIEPWNKGKKLSPLSEEHKQHISASGTGLKRKEGSGDNISKGLKGRKLSLKHIEKIRKKQRKVFRKCIFCGYEMTYREFNRGHENKCRKHHNNEST